jgi:hypothetical protein
MTELFQQGRESGANIKRSNGYGTSAQILSFNNAIAAFGKRRFAAQEPVKGYLRLTKVLKISIRNAKSYHLLGGKFWI